MGSQSKTRMGKKGFGQCRVAGDAGQAAAGFLGRHSEIGGAQIGQLSSLDIAPERFDRVEVRRIGCATRLAE